MEIEFRKKMQCNGAKYLVHGFLALVTFSCLLWCVVFFFLVHLSLICPYSLINLQALLGHANNGHYLNLS